MFRNRSKLSVADKESASGPLGLARRGETEEKLQNSRDKGRGKAAGVATLSALSLSVSSSSSLLAHNAKMEALAHMSSIRMGTTEFHMGFHIAQIGIAAGAFTFVGGILVGRTLKRSDRDLKESRDPTTSPERLSELARSRNPTVKANVRAHQLTPLDIKNQLDLAFSMRTADHMRGEARMLTKPLQRRRVSVAGLEALAHHHDEKVVRAAGQRRFEIDREEHIELIVEMLMGSLSHLVTTDELAELVDHPNRKVRMRVYERTSPDGLGNFRSAADEATHKYLKPEFEA